MHVLSNLGVCQCEEVFSHILLTHFLYKSLQEAELFAATVVSDNAKGLVNLFFAIRATSKVGVSHVLLLCFSLFYIFIKCGRCPSYQNY